MEVCQTFEVECIQSVCNWESLVVELVVEKKSSAEKTCT